MFATVALVGALFFLESIAEDYLREHSPVEALILDGERLISGGELDRAQEVLEEALALAEGGEHEPAVHLRLAQAEWEREEFSEAFERLEDVVATFPEHAEYKGALYLLAGCRESRMQDDLAVEIYRRIALEFPGEQEEVDRRLAEVERKGDVRADLPEQLEGLGYL